MDITCGYGYKPNKTLWLSFGVLVVFGFVYWILGLLTAGGLQTSDDIIIKSLGKCLYFSVINFTTTGFGDITPVGKIAKTLSGIEALSGIILMSLFIFALTKRFGS